MTESIILAVDLGTSSMKVALITISGKVLGWETEPLHLAITPEGGVEQSPKEWWGAFLSAAGRVIAKNHDLTASIRAICCSTQGEGTVPVDRGGHAIGKCMLWMDMRGASPLRNQLKGLINIDGVDVFKLLRFLRLTGGMPNLSGKDPAGHMLFMREAQSGLYAKTYKFLNVLDYMILRLTGEFISSYDSIVTSWVTDNRNPNHLTFDQGLISILGIDRDKLPEMVPCSTVVGDLKTEIAAELGLGQSIKVVAGAIDNTAAAIGSGAVEDYQPHLYIGTSSWIAAHVPFKRTDAGSSLASIPCALPDRYLLTALQATAGGNLTFLRDNVIYHKDMLLQDTEVADIFKVFDQIAARVPPGSNGVIYTPWIWGERAPVEDKTVRAGLFNLSLHHTRAEVIRAFLEGIALNTKWLCTPVEKFLGRKVTSINMIGGGAQSEIWCQIFADVLDVEIRQVSDPVCANARGAAWIGAVGLGDIKFQDIPGLVKFKNCYSPDKENAAMYKERFEAFKSIYKRMKVVYKRLNH